MWKKMTNFAKYRDYSKSKKEILNILFLTRIQREPNQLKKILILGITVQMISYYDIDELL